MKKWIIALAGLAALWAVHPFHGVDAGSLCVVETLLIEAKQGQVQVAAGTLEGNGETVPEALKDMAENTPGTLFLRQVRRIILCGEQNGARQVMELPDEIPLGAIVYTCSKSAAELQSQDDLEQVLEAREQRDRSMPDLASIKNQWLERQKTGKAVG